MNIFKTGWEEQKLPLAGKVVVIDASEKCRVGLSAMQMNALSRNASPQGATLKFGKKKVSCDIWNAFGGAHTEGAADIRLTDKAAEALGCKAGDTVIFTDVDTKPRSMSV